MATSEDGPAKKKLKKESNDEKEGQVQVEVAGRCFMDELPAEMLLKILKNLDAKNLFSVRVLNRNLNGIASEILRSRCDLELQFICNKVDKGKLVIENENKQSLLDFIECFVGSKNLPYSRFRFDQIDWTLLRSRSWTKFLTTFGGHVKCLKLKTRHTSADSVVIKLMDKLRDLLLNQLPKLEEFGLDLDHKQSSNSSTIKLFPTPAENTEESTTTTTSLAVRLPHLKVIYLNSGFPLKFTGIARDLLEAAVNLQKIDYSDASSCYEFPFLQSVGKLGCVQDTAIILRPDDLSKIKKASTAPLALKLKDLQLFTQCVYRDTSSWPDLSVFLSNLFESSKDTLSDITMESIGFLQNLKLPKFSNLTTLTIYEETTSTVEVPIIPPGLQLAYVFPALRSLTLEVPATTVFSQNSTGSIPNLNYLQVTGNWMNKDLIAKFAVMFPNLKDFKISADGMKNFHEVGTAIWTHMKQIKSLEFYIDLGPRANAFPAIDSCFTGFSEEYCQHLYDLLEPEDSEKEQEDSQLKIPQSELDAKRKNPSILDLKDLDNLTLWLYRCSYDDEEYDQKVTKKAITEVSHKYAFELMDKFRPKIRKF